MQMQVDTCRRNGNFVASHRFITVLIQDTCRRRQGIQVDTTCIRATCIFCKRGFNDSDEISVADMSRTMHLTATSRTANTSCWKDQSGRLLSLERIHRRCWNGTPQRNVCLLHCRQNSQTVGQQRTSVSMKPASAAGFT